MYAYLGVCRLARLHVCEVVCMRAAVWWGVCGYVRVCGRKRKRVYEDSESKGVVVWVGLAVRASKMLGAVWDEGGDMGATCVACVACVGCLTAEKAGTRAANSGAWGHGWTARAVRRHPRPAVDTRPSMVEAVAARGFGAVN